MDVFMEKGLCLERTKMGSNDKDHAYVVSRNQGTCIAGSIFIGFLVCAAAIIEFKAEMLTSVVNERRMERIAEMAEREEHRPEAKLMRVSARLEAHLIRDKQEKNHLKAYKQSQTNLLTRYQSLLTTHTGSLAGDALGEAVIKATSEFHQDVSRLSSEHTKALHHEGEVADARLRTLRAEITGELTAGEGEAKEDKRLAAYDGEHAPDAPPTLTEVDRDQRVEAERAVSHMLERFQTKLSQVKRMPAAARLKLKQWKKLQGDIEDGRVDYDAGEKTIRQELEDAKVHLPKATAAGDSLHDHFAEVVEGLEMLDAKHDVMSTLQQWTDGSLSVHQTLLAIQKLVNENRVNPNWLIDPEEDEGDAAGVGDLH